MKSNLVWNKAAMKKREKTFGEAQNYVDKQCVRQMTPYVPVGRPSFEKSGRLRDSVKIAKPGKIIFTAPFAKNDYYSTVDHKHGGNPRARRLWFEVMKFQHGEAILRGAARIAGGKAKWT